ncbi:protein ELC isoform X2 [Cornus florida]|nr:protein ELC isoform X2 [Cornus florida]
MLSYTDPDQKWLIREHLISLLQDFPSLNPSIDTFTHNDGTRVNLLIATGELHIPHSTIAIPVAIWLHEDYPNMPPIVFVSSNSNYPIRRDHSFVDTSGAITTPYLETWLYPRCNLSNLVRNLLKLFSHSHPFYYSPSSSFVHPSRFSKREALDRVACSLHYDTVALRAKTEEEIEELSVLQVEMVKRVDVTTSMIIGLEHERTSLKKRTKDLMEEADVLLNWVKVHDHNKNSVAAIEIDDVFETVDDESKRLMDCLAADWAMDDLIYALDKAVEQGVVTFEMYIKQVRILARKQFYYRYMQMKKGSYGQIDLLL